MDPGVYASPPNSYSLWGAVPSQWPRRLLHVSSWVSHERRKGNVYNGDKEPFYSILTYTWGRWQVDEGPSLEVHGLDWSIPAVSEDHFTVASLRHVLKQMTLDVEYVWIDVACIDQENVEVKMEEVGRQVGIFQQARKVYAWLNWHAPEDLQKYTSTISRECVELVLKGKSEAEEETLLAVDSMLHALKELLRDPWFSSLWTLQESVLRRDAILLNREGGDVRLEWTDESPALLAALVSACTNVYETLGRIVRGQSLPSVAAKPGSFAKVQELKSLIEESAFEFLYSNNPNVQYGVTRFRKTSRAVDRIYAIIQIYGLRLGQAAEPQRQFTLEELEKQFVSTLNSQSPVLAQAFVHSGTPKPGESYRINPYIIVPDRLSGIYHSVAHCQISVDLQNEAYFAGKACSMEEMMRLWNPTIHLTQTKSMTSLFGKAWRVSSWMLSSNSTMSLPRTLTGLLRDIHSSAKHCGNHFGSNSSWVGHC